MIDNEKLSEKELIVLGMHRSGTSLVSAWLNHCKLNVGDRLGGPGISNQMGHFEDLDFLALHTEILTSNDIGDRGLIPPFEIELNKYYCKKIESIIYLKRSLRKQWAWKEPRTCLFLEYYRKLLPYAYYLILFRNYPFVVDSLLRRDANSLKKKISRIDAKERQHFPLEREFNKILSLKDTYLETWIIYNERVLSQLACISKDRYLVYPFYDFISSDRKIFDHLTSWGFELTFFPISFIYDPNLINHSDPELNFPPELEDRAKIITEKFKNLFTDL